MTVSEVNLQLLNILLYQCLQLHLHRMLLDLPFLMQLILCKHYKHLNKFTPFDAVKLGKTDEMNKITLEKRTK